MKYLNVDEAIDILKIDDKIITKLNEVNINNIKDLWILKRKELKDLNFSDSEINHIRIKLQLCGLDLNKKTYI